MQLQEGCWPQGSLDKKVFRVDGSEDSPKPQIGEVFGFRRAPRGADGTREEKIAGHVLCLEVLEQRSKGGWNVLVWDDPSHELIEIRKHALSQIKTPTPKVNRILNILQQARWKEGITLTELWALVDRHQEADFGKRPANVKSSKIWMAEASFLKAVDELHKAGMVARLISQPLSPNLSGEEVVFWLPKVLRRKPSRPLAELPPSIFR